MNEAKLIEWASQSKAERDEAVALLRDMQGKIASLERQLDIMRELVEVVRERANTAERDAMHWRQIVESRRVREVAR